MGPVASRVRTWQDRIDSATRGWFLVVGGTLARHALGLIASVLIVRSLGPTDFGTYAVLGAVANVVGALADAGLTGAVVRQVAAVWPDDPVRAFMWGRVFFWLRVGVAFLVVGVGLGLAGPLGHGLLGLPGRADLWLSWALLGVAATAMSGALQALLQAIGAFGRITLLMLTNAALTVLLAAVLAPLGLLNLGTALVVLGVGTSLITFVVGLRLLPPGWVPAWPGRAALIAEGRRLLAFGRWLAPAGCLGVLTSNLDVLILHAYSAPAAVGTYALAANLAAKADVVNQGLYTVLMPAAAAIRDAGTLRTYVRRSLRRSLGITFGLVVLGPVAVSAIPWLYGPAYGPAATLFGWLLAAVAVDVFLIPLSLLALPMDEPRLLAGVDALRALGVAAGGLLLIPAHGPFGAVAARWIGRLAGGVLLLGFLARRRQALVKGT